MNTEAFPTLPQQYFADSYEQFERFGGPCVYFHRECLNAGQKEFLSARHLEMLYATLTAWGCHRMGDSSRTKTKLTAWKIFHDSIRNQADELRQFLGCKMLELSEDEYANSVGRLRSCYKDLKVTEAGSTVVANSKTLHHLFPEFIPPIDRQYTIRFFHKHPDEWRNSKRKFRQIPLPVGDVAQFDLFHKTCVKIKQLADQVNHKCPTLFHEQQHFHVHVWAPKAMDNAIVNFVRKISREQ